MQFSGFMQAECPEKHPLDSVTAPARDPLAHWAVSGDPREQGASHGIDGLVPGERPQWDLRPRPDPVHGAFFSEPCARIEPAQRVAQEPDFGRKQAVLGLRKG